MSKHRFSPGEGDYPTLKQIEQAHPQRALSRTLQMNQIVSLNTASTLTMSSREIATLTGKRHDHVMRDIRNMLSGLQINGPNFGGVYIDTKGEARSCFNLPKRETLILVSGYSVELRARIIDRWMELEEQHAKTQVAPFTATEVSTMMARYMADMQETIVAPLVKIVADLIQSHQPVDQKPTAKAYIPSAEDLTPNLSARMVSQIEGVPNISNQEIGSLLTAYSYANGFQKDEKKNGAFKTGYYCRAAVVGCFQLA